MNLRFAEQRAFILLRRMIGGVSPTRLLLRILS